MYVSQTVRQSDEGRMFSLLSGSRDRMKYVSDRKDLHTPGMSLWEFEFDNNMYVVKQLFFGFERSFDACPRFGIWDFESRQEILLIRSIIMLSCYFPPSFFSYNLVDRSVSLSKIVKVLNDMFHFLHVKIQC